MEKGAQAEEDREETEGEEEEGGGERARNLVGEWLIREGEDPGWREGEKGREGRMGRGGKG